MIPFLLAAAPLLPVQAHPPHPLAAQPSVRSGTLMAAKPNGIPASCPAPDQAQALAYSNGTRAAGNNFNLGAITELFPTSLATRPSGLVLNVPLTTGSFAVKSNDGTNSSTSAPAPCSSRFNLTANVIPVTVSTFGTSPSQAGLGFSLAGTTVADALFDPSGSSDAQLLSLLGENRDYSLTAYQKRSGFNRRLNGWLVFNTNPSSIRDLRGKSSSGNYLVGSITLAFNNSDSTETNGIDYPIIHVASLGSSTLLTSAGSNSGSLGSQLKLSKINGEAAPSNAMVLLSGRNLAVADNSISNNAADRISNKAFGSAIVKGEGIRSLTFDVYVQGNGTRAGSTFADNLSTGQDRFLLTLSSAKETPLAYGYGSIQAGIGVPGTYSGTFSVLGVSGQRNTLDLSTGFNGELALGYKGRQVRSDLSVGYSSFGNQQQTIGLYDINGAYIGSASTPGTGNVSLLTVMANGYLDFKMRNNQGAISRWSPYVGGGLGIGSLTSPSCSLPNCTLIAGGSGTGFAYQLKAGVSYRANDTSRLFLEGGYLGLTGTQAGNVNYDAFGTWRVNLGWRQSF